MANPLIQNQTTPETHPTGVAPVSVPKDHYFWAQVSGHFDENSGRLFDNLLRSIGSTYGVSDAKLLAPTANERILILLPPDSNSRSYLNSDVRIITSSLSASLDSIHSIEDVPVTDSIGLPQVGGRDGYIFIHNDGLMRHIWFNFRQSDKQAWSRTNETEFLGNPVDQGLFARHVFEAMDKEPLLREKLENNGWYFLPLIRPGLYLSLAKEYKASTSERGDQLILEELNPERLRQAFSEWNANELFKKREHLTEEIADMYAEGKYAGCLTLALAQFSGIIYDKFGRATDREVAAAIEKLIPDDQRDIRGFTRTYLLRFVKTVFRGPGKEEGAQLPHDRKAVMHGNKTAFSRREALQVIVLLDSLYHALHWHEEWRLDRSC